MKALVAGIDIGTSNLKVGIYDLAGRIQAVAECACAPVRNPAGRVAIDTAVWDCAFETAWSACLAAVDRAALRAIAVSSQAQTYVLLDGAGRPAGPAVSWLDATGDSAGVAATLGGRDVYAHTGWPEPHPLFAVCKLRGDARARGAARVLFADGYLLYRLTGQLAVSRNLAAMSGLYSLLLGDWWPEAVAAAGISPAALPAVREPGSAVGVLTGAFAAAWELPPVPVFAGANDQTAAAIGAGLAQPGAAALNLGTAMVAYQVVAARKPPPACRPLRGPYVAGRCYHLLVCETGGELIAQARAEFAPRATWERFYAEALAAPPGADGIRFDAVAAVQAGLRRGLREDGPLRTDAQRARAVLEGLACCARAQLDGLGVRGPVRLTGGGARHPGWIQLLSDVTGRALVRLEEPHAGVRGTALLAAHGAGLTGDLPAAIAAWQTPGTRFRPTAARRALYEAVYRDTICPLQGCREERIVVAGPSDSRTPEGREGARERGATPMTERWEEDLQLWGAARDRALEEMNRQVAAWGLKMPAGEPLVIRFGLNEFRRIGEIEYWIVNDLRAGYCGKFLFVFDGQTCPEHHHRVKHETFYVIKGRVMMQLAGRERVMESGETLVMPPGAAHSFTGVGNALLLEVSMPSTLRDNFFADRRIGRDGVI
jgi:xylulokinase